MPQCKLDNCREQAVDGPWRKRYCREHGERYLERRREHEKRAAAAPKCEHCGTAPLLSGLSLSLGLCAECEDEARERRAEQEKERMFNDAVTVEDLKDWMRMFLL